MHSFTTEDAKMNTSDDKSQIYWGKIIFIFIVLVRVCWGKIMGVKDQCHSKLSFQIQDVLVLSSLQDHLHQYEFLDAPP